MSNFFKLSSDDFRTLFSTLESIDITSTLFNLANKDSLSLFDCNKSLFNNSISFS